MGNNHDKYFGKDQRKILILGLPQAGKTTILEALTKGKETNTKNQKTKDLTIKDAKLGSLLVTFFDLSGGERQRIFWKQHYDGSQGIIFAISCTGDRKEVETSIGEIEKLAKVESLKGIPFAICLQKSDQKTQQQTKELAKLLKEALSKIKLNYRTFDTGGKNSPKMKEMITWLLQESKPL